jgi:SpoIID/LytB domain protein
VTLLSSTARTLERIRREHAVVLSCACVSIFLFLLSPARFSFTPFRFVGVDATRDEAALDAVLQDAATTALANREGTIIVMDAHSGRVRAIVNPEAAYSQALLPGSAIKPFTALAALRAGLINEDSRTVCPGRFTGLSFSLPCVHADHLPPFSPPQAIAYSCNYYFATLGQRLGRDQLIATLREFDFGQTSGVNEEEAAGSIRPCETGAGSRIVRGSEANHVSEQADCAAREAIGESENLQVTPIQLLTGYTALVNGGHLYAPRIAPAEAFVPVERSQIVIAPEHRALITDGMAGVIRYGTARSAKLDSLPLTIIGKTGTANPAKGFRTNGWFVGFAGPFSSKRETDPSQIDLAILVLLPRTHGSQAAGIAKPVFAAYAAHQKPDREGGQDSLATSSGAPLMPTDQSTFGNPQSAIVKVHLVHDNITEGLSLEDYVLGVMRAEGTTESEPEALKALAIAIRTYALKNIGRHAKDGYDFCSTTHCQRFVGVPGAPASLSRPVGIGAPPTRTDAALVDAVRGTENQVLLDNHSQPIDSYFGASCGGETANIGTLWGIAPPEYLRGVRDEYCESGPHATWQDTISRSDLARALQSDSRTDTGSHLDNVVISQRDETGRAEFITVEGEHRKTVRGWDFKIIVGRVLGWNVLKSSRFEISRSGSNFIFRGSGFGHGLGLCQEGAHVMAARGASYQKILEKYFPGTSVKPRSGNVSSAQPFKAGEKNQNAQFAASATSERSLCEASLTRRSRWRADVFPALKGRAEFTRRFAAAEGFASRLLIISSDHFRLTYPDDVERRDADQALKTLESARADYLRRASSTISDIPSLEIRFNESTGDFTSRTGQPSWAAAATKGNRIELQPLPLLKRRGVLWTTLRHELAHAVIDAVSHNHASRWLTEGFALYLAGEGQTITRELKRRVFSEDELEKRLERPSSADDMRSLYAQAYVHVEALVREQGEPNVWKKLAEN